MKSTLGEGDLPGFWRAADTASLAGQGQALRLTRLRIFGLVIAAACGMLSPLFPQPTWVSVVAVLAFIVVLAVEVVSWVQQPERDWYSGRALAESAKTLAWRFSVCGAPFGPDLGFDAAERILAVRLDEVSREARDRVTVGPGGAVTTERMRALRSLPFDERRASYVEGRVVDQHEWYSRKARENRTSATRWRLVLIAGEIAAVVLAIVQALQPLPVAIAGFAATLIGCAGAWVAVKQYSNLASAYSVTATELALLKPQVEAATAEQWADVVDDAEEAISREHTLWLASRTGRSPAR